MNRILSACDQDMSAEPTPHTQPHLTVFGHLHCTSLDKVDGTNVCKAGEIRPVVCPVGVTLDTCPPSSVEDKEKCLASHGCMQGVGVPIPVNIVGQGEHCHIQIHSNLIF